MKKKALLLTILAVLLLIALAAGQFLSQFTPVKPEDAERLLSRSEAQLRTIAQNAVGIYQSGAPVGLDAIFFPGNRIQSIDGRYDNGIVCFDFDSHHMEGFTSLYYCPDGAIPAVLEWWSREEQAWKSLASLDGIPPEGLRVENLGINGQGYLFAVMLRPDWCFVDAYLPT